MSFKVAHPRGCEFQLRGVSSIAIHILVGMFANAFVVGVVVIVTFATLISAIIASCGFILSQ